MKAWFASGLFLTLGLLAIRSNAAEPEPSSLRLPPISPSGNETGAKKNGRIKSIFRPVLLFRAPAQKASDSSLPGAGRNFLETPVQRTETPVELPPLAAPPKTSGNDPSFLVQKENVLPQAPATVAAAEPVMVLGEDLGDPGPRTCPYPPGRLWGAAEYLLWWTKGNPLPPLLTTSPAGTPLADAGVLGKPGTSVVFGNETVDNRLRSGGRFTLGGWLNQRQTTGVEGNFFFLEQLSTNFSISSDGLPILARPFINLDPADPDFGKNASLKIAYPGFVKGSFQATTSSNLLGTDVYVRQGIWCGPCGRIDLLGGYRFLRLREDLQISETEISTSTASPLFGIPFVINEGFDASNNFHGGELGLMAEFMRNRWFVRGVGKVGLGGTTRNVNIHGTTQVGSGPVETGGFLALPSNIGDYHSTVFSVVPEVILSVGYAVTPWLRVYTGYSFLYWTNVVRPGDQIDLGVNGSQPPLGGGLVGDARPAFSFKHSDFWAQGIHLGLEIRY